MPVPPLKHYEGSWVAVSRASGKAVLETFSRATAEAVNQTRYEVVTNRRLAGAVQPSSADREGFVTFSQGARRGYSPSPAGRHSTVCRPTGG